MKRIGILTIHRIYNHGSFLQAFALKKTVEKILGEDTKCELLDWPMRDRTVVRPVYAIPNDKVRQPKGLRFWIHKKLGHIQHCRDIEITWLYNQLGHKYESQCHYFLNVMNEPNYSQMYDIIIVGSDESFNCTQEDAKWDALYCFKLRCRKIISYAASFGYSTVSRLQRNNVNEIVKNGLSGYVDISVRDSNSKEIVKELTSRESLIHLDPVLIFNYDEFIPTIKINSDFILIYNYVNRINDPEFIASIKLFAKRERLKIISIFEYCPWADRNLALTSFEVLAYFKKAKYVVTDTFHGAVMSIKFNKRFVVFVRDSNYNKLYYLLNRFGLDSQIISKDSDFQKILNNCIDWKNINNEINNETQKSVDYLTKHLQAK